MNFFFSKVTKVCLGDSGVFFKIIVVVVYGSLVISIVKRNVEHSQNCRVQKTLLKIESVEKIQQA